MTDEHAGLVMCDQPIVLGVRGGRQVRSGRYVCCSGKEPQASGFQAQTRKEQSQRWLVLAARVAYGHRRAVAEPNELGPLWRVSRHSYALVWEC